VVDPAIKYFLEDHGIGHSARASRSGLEDSAPPPSRQTQSPC
jgi:hypothetical protein